MNEHALVVIAFILTTVWMVRYLTCGHHEVKETVSLVIIFFIFEGIFCSQLLEIWYIFAACLCCILLACFFVKYINLKKELEIYNKKELKIGFVVIYGEVLNFNVPKVQRSYSTIVYENKQPIGALSATSKSDLGFLYTCSKDSQIYLMQANQKEFFKGLSVDYSLTSETVNLRLERAGKNRLSIKNRQFSCNVPLNLRKFSLSRQDGVRAEFVITCDGFLLYCSESEGPILTCIAYFLMLYHWGNLRMD